MSQKIIVIGGLSAGPSAAAKARRENENAEILLFEKTRNVSYATCGIPYALSGVIKDRKKLLVVEADLLRTRFNIDVRLEEEVLEILPQEHKIVTSKGVYEYDKLVYTAGARTVIPKIENLQFATNWSACRTLKDFDKIMKEGLVTASKHITVMGAGLIGVEVAENLRELGLNVTLVEGGPGVLPMWGSKFRKFAENTMEYHGINVVTNTFVNSFNVDERGNITGFPLPNGEVIQTDFVILSVGIKPNTELLTSKGAACILNGAVKVNEKMETSLPDIYAAGDCASIKNIQTNEYDYLPLGTHSNKGGRTAGMNAAGGNQTFKGGYKTAIVKVFENTLGRTGMGSDYMLKNNIDFKTNLIVAGSTPGYYPDQKDLILETYYDPKTGVILGCEAFGEHGVDKRIDVMSTAIYAKLTIEDLVNLDLAYAPPFSPAKDPVVVGGYVSGNAKNGTYQELSVEELASIISKNENNDFQIIDVRAEKEVMNSGKISRAVNYPLDLLRTSNVDLLDKDKLTIVYCAKGMRGYLSTIILEDKGFKNIKNLSGGFAIWKQLEKVEQENYVK